MHRACFACRWRVYRGVKLTAEQWNRAKSLFLHFVPQFFPNNCMLPVFVPLHDNVLMKMEELQQEHWPDPAAADHHPPPDQVQDEQPQKKRRRVDHDRPPAIDMDGDRDNMQVEEKKEAKEEDGGGGTRCAMGTGTLVQPDCPFPAMVRSPVTTQRSVEGTGVGISTPRSPGSSLSLHFAHFCSFGTCVVPLWSCD